MKKFTDAQLDALTNLDTAGAQRFIGMGFRLFDVVKSYELSRDADFVQARFVCVCGRTEFWNQLVVPDAPLELQNIYDAIVGFGSTGRDHLLEDGYSEQQIAEMEARLREFKMTDAVRTRAQHDVRGMPYFERVPPDMRVSDYYSRGGEVLVPSITDPRFNYNNGGVDDGASSQKQGDRGRRNRSARERSA